MSRADATSGIHFPPPFLYAAFLGAGLVMERLVPLGSLPRGLALGTGGVLLLAGAALIYWSLWLFWRARTSPLPMRPTTAFVRRGPYRWTRNPMYLGMLGLYLGLALWFDVPWALLAAPLLVAAVNALVIRKEERYLEARFGADYLAYKAAVRRWL